MKTKIAIIMCCFTCLLLSACTDTTVQKEQEIIINGTEPEHVEATLQIED